MGCVDKNLDINNPPPKYEEHKHVLAGWRFIALIVTVILSLISYFFFSLWGGFSQVVHGMSEIGWLGFGTFLSMAILSYLFRFARWNYFLYTLGHYVPWYKSLKIYVSGFSLTTTPGKAGEALRSMFLVDYGIAYRRSFGALLSERLSDFLAIVVLTIGGLAAHPSAMPVIILSALFIVTVLYTVQQDNWLKNIENWTNKNIGNRFARLVEFFIETILAFRECFRTHVLVYGMLLGAIAWGFEGVILYLTLKFLGTELPLYTAIFIHAFSLLVGAFTLLPGGLGGAEVTMYELLIYYEIPTSIAVTATLVVRLCTLWFSIFLGLLFLPRRQIKLG